MNREYEMKKLFKVHWIAVLFLFLGCAHSTPVVYFSRPEVQKASTEAFDAQIETLKLDNPFYVAFRLTVVNKGSGPIEINWDKTHYLINGKDYGLFVFQGIDPESIKKGIPNEAVAAGEKLSRDIMPLKTLAFRGKNEIHKAGQSNFYPGILPNGANTVLLVVAQGDREWEEPLSVQIGTREVKK